MHILHQTTFSMTCFLSTFLLPRPVLFFFFNDTATTEIYTLSLHDALPISVRQARTVFGPRPARPPAALRASLDRKSKRLNSSHGYISYAVFCLKKKKSWRAGCSRIIEH